MASRTPVSSSTESFDTPLEAQVHTEQVRTVYLASPTTTIASMLVAVLLLAISWTHVSHGLLLGWGLAVIAHQALRMYQYRAYCRASANDQAHPRWGRYYTLATTSAGLIWGSAGVMMFVPDSTLHLAMLLVVLCGVVTVSMVGLSVYAPAFFSLAPLTMLPFIVRALAEGEDEHRFLAIPALTVLILALAFGRRMNRAMSESFAKRFENVALVEQLKRRTEQLTLQKAAAEIATRAAEKATQSKMEFFRAANHDLRQPLHALGIFGHALSERIHFPEVRSIVDGMNDSIRALDRLFSELLDLSKLDAGAVVPELSHFSSRELLRRLQPDAAADAGSKALELRVRSPDLVLRSDPVLLERIVRNLVVNAIRYTEQGGVLIGCRRRGNRVRIEVWDTGVGIAENEHERVFDEFYQAGGLDRDGKKGLGLGLATVRRLAQLLHHPLGLRSVPGRGSVFSIVVPLGQKAQIKAAASGPQRSASTGFAGKVIAIVDDETPILEAMKTLLEGWGCEVLAEESTDDALAALGDLSRYPDLIIADYRLGGGKTGFEAIERLREELGEAIPAIVITASTTADDQSAAEQFGYRILHKPVMAEELQRVMNSLWRTDQEAMLPP
jgi:two-component system, sensor histidine kinase